LKKHPSFVTALLPVSKNTSWVTERTAVHLCELEDGDVTTGNIHEGNTVMDRDFPRKSTPTIAQEKRKQCEIGRLRLVDFFHQTTTLGSTSTASVQQLSKRRNFSPSERPQPSGNHRPSIAPVTSTIGWRGLGEVGAAMVAPAT